MDLPSLEKSVSPNWVSTPGCTQRILVLADYHFHVDDGNGDDDGDGDDDDDQICTGICLLLFIGSAPCARAGAY